MPPEMLIIFAVLIGVMFLSSRRNRKQQQAANEFRSNLAVGDEVMTGSGMFGTVVAVDGDAITLASPSGDETVWLRAAIAKLDRPPYAVEDDEGEDEYADEYDEDPDELDEVEDDEEPEDAGEPVEGTPGLIDPRRGSKRRRGRDGTSPDA